MSRLPGLAPRFSLRALLLTVLLLAIGLSWYGYYTRVMHRERELLSGTWRMVHDDGTPVLIHGKEQTMGFLNRETTLRMPRGDVGWIDFQGPGWKAPSRGIYRREGQRVRFAQSEIGDPRPTEFDRTKCHTLWLVERIEEHH
jgi:hypothetical protein